MKKEVYGMIQVSAAIIRNENGEILICQRGPGGNCAFLWEFPGGKREAGETPEECLVRECREELEIEISVERLFSEFSYRYPDQEIHFSFFTSHMISRTVKMDVHRDIRWVKPSEMGSFPFCPADADVIERLRKSE